MIFDSFRTIRIEWRERENETLLSLHSTAHVDVMSIFISVCYTGLWMKNEDGWRERDGKGQSWKKKTYSTHTVWEHTFFQTDEFNKSIEWSVYVNFNWNTLRTQLKLSTCQTSHSLLDMHTATMRHHIRLTDWWSEIVASNQHDANATNMHDTFTFTMHREPTLDNQQTYHRIHSVSSFPPFFNDCRFFFGGCIRLPIWKLKILRISMLKTVGDFREVGDFLVWRKFILLFHSEDFFFN